ncbi:MAG: CBS and ACT domain-containing protein [Candidatus Promineifilaceae bacterium]|nr:CBS and ACT domain-containing protein [Candidatus Promineifilaceae bacterium]
MLVKDFMTRHPIMVAPDMPAAEAQKIMAENNVRHLPVVGDGKRLEGLLTRQSFTLERDEAGSLDIWEISRFLARLEVKQVMIPAEKVYSITADQTIEQAARKMSAHKIGCLPVLEDDEIVTGILTEIDVMNTVQDMLALPVKGVRVTVRMPDRAGEFGKMTTALGDAGMGVMGIGTYPTPRREGYYDAVLKIRNVTIEQVRDVLGGVPDQEIIDLREMGG